MVRAAAHSYLGKNKKSNSKHITGWNYHVSAKHQIARQAYQIWLMCGSPPQGKLYDEMCKTRKEFKNKLKWCQQNETKIKADIIAMYRSKNDFYNFWKETNKFKYKTSLPLSVNGSCNHSEIANMFVSKFKLENSLSSRPPCTVEQSLGTARPEQRDCSEPNVLITPDKLFKIVKNMKRGKSPGHDGFSVEHILHGGPVLYEKLCLLFNTCIEHGYLPCDLLKTIVVPIIKNRTGDVSSLTNYRPISLATIVSKIFERIINEHLNEKNIPLNHAQFGFRKGLSTDLAIFSLKNTVKYYTSRNTSVYACFLDLSRAFDSINYDILWNKLRNTGVPNKITNILQHWYTRQENQVRWGQSLSAPYKLECGVRQGGLTSPVLFNYYVNGLLEELSSTRVGCHVGGACANNISYADDMVLLSPAAAGLKDLLKICENYAKTHGLTYNVKKTEVMIFKSGSGPKVVPEITLYDSPLAIVSKFKYLGHMVNDSLKDDDDIERQRRALAMRANMLARRFTHCSKQVKITLFASYCQSLYTSQLWYNYTKGMINTFRVQYNNALRAILGLPWRCSATGMFDENNVDNVFKILNRFKLSFHKRLHVTTNKIVVAIYKTVYINDKNFTNVFCV